MAGARMGVDDEIAAESSSQMPRAEVAPASVKPYAHPIRAHGQVRGLRQSRPNESSSSFRNSSVIGFGAAALHNSHRSHAAMAISNTPTQTFITTFRAPALYATRSQACITGGAA